MSTEKYKLSHNRPLWKQLFPHYLSKGTQFSLERIIPQPYLLVSTFFVRCEQPLLHLPDVLSQERLFRPVKPTFVSLISTTIPVNDFSKFGTDEPSCRVYGEIWMDTDQGLDNIGRSNTKVMGDSIVLFDDRSQIENSVQCLVLIFL